MNRNELNKKVMEFISPVQTTLRIGETVGEALSELRHQEIDHKIFYFYVIDSERCLKGVVSTRALLLSKGETKVEELISTKLVSISSDHSLREALEFLTEERLMAIPVVDQRGQLLGIIDIQLYLEEAVDVAKAMRSSTDLFHVLGLSLQDERGRSVWANYRARMPWIFCNMVGGIACAVISRVFEQVLLEMILLAMFIPLVLTLSESISMQSMTYSLQLVHKFKHPKGFWAKARKEVFFESKMVGCLALTCGVVVGSVSLLWGEGMAPAYTISIGIILSVTLSGLTGALIPLILHARKLDPKVAAGPVVLMFVDVLTTVIYLGLSTWWLLY